MSVFCQTIDQDQNIGDTIGCWKENDEIHGDAVPSYGMDW